MGASLGQEGFLSSFLLCRATPYVQINSSWHFLDLGITEKPRETLQDSSLTRGRTWRGTREEQKSRELTPGASKQAHSSKTSLPL